MKSKRKILYSVFGVVLVGLALVIVTRDNPGAPEPSIGVAGKTSAKDLLIDAHASLLRAKSFRTEASADGHDGNPTVTEFQAPDRYRYVASSGQVIIGVGSEFRSYFDAGMRERVPGLKPYMLIEPRMAAGMFINRIRHPDSMDRARLAENVRLLSVDEVFGAEHTVLLAYTIMESMENLPAYKKKIPVNYMAWIDGNGRIVQIARESGRGKYMRIRYTRYDDPAIEISLLERQASTHDSVDARFSDQSPNAAATNGGATITPRWMSAL